MNGSTVDVAALVLFTLAGGCATGVPRLAPAREFGVASFYHLDHVEVFPGGSCWGARVTPQELVGQAEANEAGVGATSSNCLSPGTGMSWSAVLPFGAYRIDILRRPAGKREWAGCQAQVTIPRGKVTYVSDRWTATDRCTIQVRTTSEFLPRDALTFREIHQWRVHWMNLAREECSRSSTRAEARACLARQREKILRKTLP